MKKIILTLLVAIVALAGYMILKPKEAMESTLEQPVAEDGVIEEVVVEKYSLEEVALHAKGDDCWLAIDGKVYDVTPFVASGFHPGKSAILEGCGKDATELFNTRPMGSGTSHSERARSMLPKYYIGDLQ